VGTNKKRLPIAIAKAERNKSVCAREQE